MSVTVLWRCAVSLTILLKSHRVAVEVSRLTVEVCCVAGHPAEVCCVAGHPAESRRADCAVKGYRLLTLLVEAHHLTDHLVEMRRLVPPPMEVPHSADHSVGA